MQLHSHKNGKNDSKILSSVVELPNSNNFKQLRKICAQINIYSYVSNGTSSDEMASDMNFFKYLTRVAQISSLQQCTSSSKMNLVNQMQRYMYTWNSSVVYMLSLGHFGTKLPNSAYNDQHSEMQSFLYLADDNTRILNNDSGKKNK